MIRQFVATVTTREEADRRASLEDQLAAVTAQRDLLAQAVADGNLNPLLARITELEGEVAHLRRTVADGGLEALLRERETNRRLQDEIHRLTYASQAADKGWT